MMKFEGSRAGYIQRGMSKHLDSLVEVKKTHISNVVNHLNLNKYIIHFFCMLSIV